MVKVIYEDNHLLVVEKPINVLVQADRTGDNDLLTILKDYINRKADWYISAEEAIRLKIADAYYK